MMKKIYLLLLAITLYANSFAQDQQEKKVVLTDTALYKTIARLDSVLFAAYNSKNLELMKTYFTKDLEWYQDNGGLIHYEQVFTNFQSIFSRDYDLTRNLLKETLEVHPIQEYGAIEASSHQFKDIENGKLEVVAFKFVLI